MIFKNLLTQLLHPPKKGEDLKRIYSHVLVWHFSMAKPAAGCEGPWGSEVWRSPLSNMGDAVHYLRLMFLADLLPQRSLSHIFRFLLTVGIAAVF